MKEDLLKLYDLQNIDTKIEAIKKNLEKLPKELDKVMDEFKPRKDKFTQNQELLKEKEAQNLTFKMELEDKANTLKELQERLSQVQNAKELSAVDKEITGVKTDISDTEEENIKLLEDIDNLKKEINEEEKIIADEQTRVDELEKNIEAQKNETSQELGGLQKEHDKIANTIPAELLKEYEFIFHKRENKAIAAINNGTCSGCFMSIPPQTVVDVRKGLKLHYCQYCSRILFFPEWES
jgi:predicted  nucleic acid-binding Zn-ribbon protein